MTGERPISPDERRRWRTFTPERTVLAIARTFTSSVRVLDALSVFRLDPRVEVVFAFDDTSAFREGVDGLLRDAGVRVIPWAEIARLDPDLALTASENVNVDGSDAPLVVLPHGIGFHKYVPDAHGTGRRLSGVVPAERLRDRQIWMATSHSSQRRQLLAEHPEAAERCVLIGDLAYDQLVASRELRGHFREVLGVRPGQRLVLVSSTWGPGSLLATHRDLPATLLGALPADDYKVALVAHPNVWFWHGPHQLGLWLADAFEAGLIRIPPDQGWQAALIAADLVIGDQGSVSLYGAALDRPLLLATGDGPVVPGSPAADLAGAADLLDHRAPLAAQVEQAIAGHPRGRFEALAGRMFERRRTDAATALRGLLYELLELPAPDAPVAVRKVPDPRPVVDAPRSYVVFSRLAADGTVTIRRWPAPVAAVAKPEPEREPGTFRHLSVGDDEPDRRLPDNAAVIVRRRTAHDGDEWLAAALRQHAGAVVAAAAERGGCVAALRDGTTLTVSGDPGDPAVTAAALYTCLRAGRLAAGPLTVRAGAAATTLSVEVGRPS